VSGLTRLKSKPHFRYYCLLFITIVVGYLATVGVFRLTTGEIPLWRSDNYALYINFAAYEGEWLRSIIGNLFAGNGLIIPEYSYSLGYGADVLLSAGGCINDPFNLLFVFCPVRYTAYLYLFLILLRLVLAGASFSFYALSKGNGHRATYIATLCYLLTGFVLFLGLFRHGNFLNVAILFPLILYGADRIFEQKNPLIFIGVLALSFLYSVYFSYMICIVLFFYCLIKYFFIPRERSAKSFLVLVLKFVLCILLAAAMAGIVVVPEILSLSSMDRVSTNREISAFFNPGYYPRLILDMVGGHYGTRGAYLGAVSVALCLIFLTARKKFEKPTWRAWTLGLVLCLLGATVSWISSAFNGFSYTTDRWMFALSFVSAYIVCLTVPVLEKLNKRDWIRASFVLAIFVGVLLFCVACHTTTWASLTTAFFAVCALILVLSGKRLSYKHLSWVVCVLLVVGTGSTVYCAYNTSDFDGLHFSRLSTFSTLTWNENPAYYMVKDGYLKPNGLCIDNTENAQDGSQNTRYDMAVRGSNRNQALLHGVSSIDYYSSFYNQYVSDFRTELNLADVNFNILFKGSNARFALEVFSGARYFVAPTDNEWLVPYGYSQIGQAKSEKNGEVVFNIYETSYAAPLAFSYSKQVSSEDYQNLSALEKQEVLLQACVLDNGESPVSTQDLLNDSSIQKLDYTMKTSDGLEIQDGKIVVTKPEASISLTFKQKPSTETYLQLKNLEYAPFTLEESFQYADDGSKTPDFWDRISWKSRTTSSINVLTNGDHNQSLALATPQNNSFTNRKDWLFNLGKLSEGTNEVSIKFMQKGTYSLSEFSIQSEDPSTLLPYSEELQKQGLQNLQLNTNNISADATVEDGTEYAFFTTPYSQGWTATVDGQPAEVLRADTAFMAIKLDTTGTHHIEMYYVTPGQKTGGALTALGLLVFVSIVIYRRKKQRMS
jgi:uncharacterized membrane protein YfhO